MTIVIYLVCPAVLIRVDINCLESSVQQPTVSLLGRSLATLVALGTATVEDSVTFGYTTVVWPTPSAIPIQFRAQDRILYHAIEHRRGCHRQRLAGVKMDEVTVALRHF